MRDGTMYGPLAVPCHGVGQSLLAAGALMKKRTYSTCTEHGTDCKYRDWRSNRTMYSMYMYQVGWLFSHLESSRMTIEMLKHHSHRVLGV